MASKSPTHPTFAAAMAAAQAEMSNPVRSSKNPAFNNEYATLETIRNAVVPVLAKHGIAIIQNVGYVDGAASLKTTLLFGAEQFDAGVAAVPIDRGRNASQQLGSAVTYLRRYSLCAIAGVAEAEAAPGGDDGEGLPSENEVTRKRSRGPSPAKQLKRYLFEQFEIETEEGADLLVRLASRDTGGPPSLRLAMKGDDPMAVVQFLEDRLHAGDTVLEIKDAAAAFSRNQKKES